MQDCFQTSLKTNLNSPPPNNLLRIEEKKRRFEPCIISTSGLSVFGEECLFAMLHSRVALNKNWLWLCFSPWLQSRESLRPLLQDVNARKPLCIIHFSLMKEITAELGSTVHSVNQHNSGQK